MTNALIATYPGQNPNGRPGYFNPWLKLIHKAGEVFDERGIKNVFTATGEVTTDSDLPGIYREHYRGVIVSHVSSDGTVRFGVSDDDVLEVLEEAERRLQVETGRIAFWEGA